VYDAAVRGTLRVAARVTSVTQSGSLRIYVTVILTTAAVAPLVAMVTGRWWPGWPDLVGSPAHVPIAAVLVGGALAAAVTRRRFAAALLLGVVGYGMTLLFVVQGAPDLALTQFAIETLSVVVFLLVFRVLPDRFDRPLPAVAQAVRLAVSGGVGAFVVLMAVASAGSRTEPSVSQEMSERALPDGDGRNIVNVILVDIRGMDTMGEITVLVTAGIGIVALARVGRTPRRTRSRRRTSIRRRQLGAAGRTD
jgi:multicomponent Na+:H+ antiporter subunit A